MITTQKIKINLSDKQERPTVDVVQGDSARAVAISLYAGTAAWTVPTGSKIQIRFRKPDGTGGSYDTLPDGTTASSISGSTVTVRLAPEMMTVPGITQMQVVILDGTTALATFTANLSVEPDPSLDTLNSKDYVNHIGWLHGELDKLYDQTFVDGGYIGSKVDALHNRVDTIFERGTLNAGYGMETTQSNRIRSDFFPHGGRQITVVIPEGVKAQCFFYDADHVHTSHSGFRDRSFTIYNDSAYARCVAAYSDDSPVNDIAALADKVAIFYPSQAHDAFQGHIRTLGYTSFAACVREGYYQFAGADVSAISDAPEITSGGILEVHPHAGTDVVMQTIRTTSGEVWFRWSDHPFRRILPQEQDVPILSANVRWYALGDSITQGYYSDAGGLKFDADKGWAALAAQYNGWELTNYAVGGSGFVHKGTVGDKLNARDHVDTIDFSEAELVTLAFGVNDWKGGDSLGSMADDVAAGGTLYSNMRYCIEKILSDNPCAKIVVISPINCCAYGDQETNWGIGHAFSGCGTLEDVFNAQRKVCEYYGIEFIDLLHGSAVNRLNAPEVLPDGVHPSAQCHRMLAAELSQKIMGVNPAASGAGACYVTARYRSDKTYMADMTNAELMEAYTSGAALYCRIEGGELDGFIFPLAGIDENNCYFIGLSGYYSITVGIRADTVAVTSTNLQGSASDGEDGGYYQPSITKLSDTEYSFAFYPSKPDMPYKQSVKITLPSGADGKSAYQYAQDGGYTGTEEEFAAKLAEEMPNIAPVEATADMTQSVGIDGDGKLWTAPGNSGTFRLLDVYDFSSGALSYATTGVNCHEIIVVVTAALETTGAKFLINGLHIGDTPKLVGGCSRFTALGDGTIIYLEPRITDYLANTKSAVGSGAIINSIGVDCSSASSGIIRIYGR